MKTEIKKIIYPGLSLSNIKQKTILTDEGLPGEIVSLKPIKDNKSHILAQTTEILKTSPNRIEPKCSHYKICSKYQYIDYPQQLNIKQEQFINLLNKALLFDISSLLKIRPAQKIWGYRNKIHLKVIWKNNLPQIAYNLVNKSDQFLGIDHCYLVSEQLNEIARKILEIAEREKIYDLEELILRENSQSDQVVIALLYKNLKLQKGLTKDFHKLISKFPITGITFINKKTKRRFRYKNTLIKEKIHKTSLFFSTDTFFQINISMINKVINDILENTSLDKTKIIADLYSGTGTFGIILSRIASKVIAIEKEKDNLEILRKNIQENNINNLLIITGDVKDNINKLFKESPEIIIIDPPRRGINQEITRKLSQKGPEYLLYISCNPQTLARDLKILNKNYSLEKVFVYDFFPHTPHIESLTILKRRIK